MASSRLDPTVAEALSALDSVLKTEFARCKRAEEARDAIKSAAVEGKRHVFYSHLKLWADCLSQLIEGRFDDHVRVACSILSHKNAITWADRRLRQSLE